MIQSSTIKNVLKSSAFLYLSNTKPKIMNNSNIFNLGLATAAIGIVLFLVQAIFIDSGMVLSSIIGLLSILAAIILPIIYIKKQRRENGDSISFKNAFLVGFLGLALSGIIVTAFTYIYAGYINTEYAEQMTYNQMETTQGFLGSLSDEQQAEILREMESDMMERFTFLGLLKTFSYLLIFYAVLCLILAAIFKRKPAAGSDFATTP
jgi:hypothetical protein